MGYPGQSTLTDIRESLSYSHGLQETLRSVISQILPHIKKSESRMALMNFFIPDLSYHM